MRRRLLLVGAGLAVAGVVVTFVLQRSSAPGCNGARQLQERIDKAGRGDTITISGEQCLADRVVVNGKRGLTLRGDGTAVLRQEAGHDDKLLVLSRSRDVTIERLEVAGSSPAAGNRPGAYDLETAQSSAIAVKGVVGLRLTDLHVHDVYGDFVDLDEGPDGEFTTDVVISGNRFERSGRQGVSFGSNLRRIEVTDNDLREVRRSVFDFEPGDRDAVTSDVHIADNRADDYRNFFVTVAGVGGLDGLRIEGNRVSVRGGENGGIAFVRVGARKAEIAPVTGLVVCNNTGDLVDENRFSGAVDPVTTC